jgi:hypothetical protein
MKTKFAKASNVLAQVLPQVPLHPVMASKAHKLFTWRHVGVVSAALPVVLSASDCRLFYVGSRQGTHTHTDLSIYIQCAPPGSTPNPTSPHPTPPHLTSPHPTPPNPNPPHPKVRFLKFNGRFQLLIWPWLGGARPGQEALGAKKVPLGRLGSGPSPGPRHFLRPKRHLAMHWRRRRQAMAK